MQAEHVSSDTNNQRREAEEGRREEEAAKEPKHAQRYPEEQRLTDLFVTLFLLHKEQKDSVCHNELLLDFNPQRSLMWKCCRCGLQIIFL